VDKKYELLKDDTIELKTGRILYRIRSLKDFSTYRAEEAEDGDCVLKKVKISTGTLGGYIESEVNLSQEGNCWVFNENDRYSKECDLSASYVYANAKIRENATIAHFTEVCDNAVISGNACITNGVIFGNAMVRDNAIISFGYVYENAEIYEHAKLYINSPEVHGNAKIHGYAELTMGHDGAIYDHAEIYEHAKIGGSSIIHGNAKISGYVELENCNVSGDTNLAGDIYLINSTLRMNSLKIKHFHQGHQARNFPLTISIE